MAGFSADPGAGHGGLGPDGVPDLSGLFGDLPVWTVEMLNSAYFTGVIGLACLLGYWLIQRYLRKPGLAQEPEPSPQPRRSGRRVSRP